MVSVTLPRTRSVSVKTTALRGLGGGFFLLGAIGIFVPLLPTTGFWILAVMCWAKSAPALSARLLNHPRYGRGLSDWIHHGVIRRRGKAYAIGGMTLGASISFLTIETTWQVKAIIIGTLLAAAIWIGTRPEDQRDETREQ